MLKQVLTIMDRLDHPAATAASISDLFLNHEQIDFAAERFTSEKGSTEFVKICIKGLNGRSVGGSAPTLGVLGRLGGIGARPEMLGLVSDADGALAALSVALKLTEMAERGDRLQGDVIVATHICPNAPTLEHKPVPFMGSPVSMEITNRYEVDTRMEAILSIDTTRGNRLLNHRGIAITATVKNGVILKVSDDLLDVYERCCGITAKVLAITSQDITPYGNGVFHVNSIMQPCVVSEAPVVGLAITAESVVPGCASNANHETDIALAARFALETAICYGAGKLKFYDEAEYERFTALYGDCRHYYPQR